MSNKAKKAAAEVTRPKAKTGSKKSWRRLMWDAVSIYDVEAVSLSSEPPSSARLKGSQGSEIALFYPSSNPIAEKRCS